MINKKVGGGGGGEGGGGERAQKIPFLNVPTTNYITINKKSTYVSPERGDNLKLRNFFYNFYNLGRASV